MKHRVAGRKLGRTSAHRLALLRNLATSLFDKERITTTLMKAKELRPFAEKLVTLSKRETLHARRRVLRHIHDKAVVGKLFDTLAARYAQRHGGYLRILKLGARRGDSAEMALVELVGSEAISAKKAEEKGKAAKKAGKAEAAKAAAADAEPAETRAKRPSGERKKKATEGSEARKPRAKVRAKSETKSKSAGGAAKSAPRKGSKRSGSE